MIAAFLGFVKEIVAGILSFLAGVLRWCRENPKKAIAILVLVLSNALTWHFTTKYQKDQHAQQISTLKGEIKKCNDETEKRNAKIEQLEKESKVVADATDKALTNTHKKMGEIISQYEKKLAAERAKNRTVTIKDPETNKDVKVELNPAGQVVCSRLHDTFKDTVNELVREANKPAKPASAP